MHRPERVQAVTRQLPHPLAGGSLDLVPDYVRHLDPEFRELLGVGVGAVGSGDTAMLRLRPLGRGRVIYFHPPSNTILGYEDEPDPAALAEECETLNKREPFIFNPAAAGRIRVVEYFVTDACNLKCRYCYLGPLPGKVKPSDRNPDRFLARMERLFEEGRFANPITVSFLGGEPLLAFAALREAVLGLQELGRRFDTELDFRMTTNGTLLTGEIAGFLVSSRVKVKVSYDGRFQMRNRPPKSRKGIDFERVLSLLLEIDGHVPVTVSATLQASQFEEQAAVFSEVHHQGFRSIQLSVVNAAPWTPDDLRAYFRGLYALRRRCVELGVRDTGQEQAMKTFEQGQLHRSFCGAGVSHVAFNSVGEERGCSTSFNEGVHGRNVVYGPHNVDDDPDCHRCAFRYGCAGGCRAFKKDGRPCITECAPNFLRHLFAIALITGLPGLAESSRTKKVQRSQRAC